MFPEDLKKALKKTTEEESFLPAHHHRRQCVARSGITQSHNGLGIS
jgi:hypothetical protein